MGRCGGDKVVETVDINREQLAPALFAHLGEVARLVDACVADHDVETTERLDRVSHQLGDAGSIGYIGGQCERPVGAEPGDRLRQWLGSPAGDHHPGAVVEETAGDRTAHARTRSRDQHRLAGQFVSICGHACRAPPSTWMVMR